MLGYKDIRKKNVNAWGFVLLLLGAGVIVVSAATGFFVLREWRAETSRFFSAALEKNGVSEKVLIQGTPYNIDRGSVVRADGTDMRGNSALPALRLAYALTLARRSPLFDLEGNDPASMEGAAQGLEEAARTLGALQEKPHDAELVKTALYPVDLVRELATLERLRKQFIASGADQDEVVYNAQIKVVLGTFKKDLERFRSAFQDVVPDVDYTYALFGGTISRSSVLRAMEATLRGLDETRIRYEDRARCLRGLTTSCNTSELHIALPDLGVQNDSRAPKWLPGTVREAIAIVSEVDGDPLIKSTPVVALTSNSCGVPGPSFFITTHSTSFGSAAYPLFVGDLFFYPVAELAAQENAQIAKYFAHHGIEYMLASPFQFYACPSSGEDASRVDAVVETWNVARDLRAKWAAVASLSEPILGEREALEFVRNELSAATGPSSIDMQRVLLPLALMFKDRSSGYDRVAMTIVERDMQKTKVKGANIPIDLSAPYLFLTHAGFPSLFLLHNPSAVSGHLTTYESADTPIFEKVIPFSRLKGSVPLDVIIRNIRFFFTMYYAPGALSTE